MSLILDGTNGLSDVDGSAATPAIRGSDANTGVFFGSDVVGLSTGGSERVRVDASGNVGIGTSSPTGISGRKTQVIRGTTSELLLQSSSATESTSDGITVTAAGSDAYYVNRLAGAHIWTSGSGGNTERARIDSSGNLLVGTASLSGSPAKFLVQRDSVATAATTVNIYNSAATSTSRLASSLVRIASQGNGADCGIQVTDSAAHNYYFGGNNGGAYVVANSGGVRLSSGGTSWASDSDERVKDIIEPITNAAEKVSTLRAVIGKYKTDEEGTRRAFLIAQDVQAVLPEAVVAQSDEIGTLSLAYTEVIPLLVAAIQEQQAIITALTARVEALEGAQA
jgi:hypothetical protein